jgi:hypothetical protein
MKKHKKKIKKKPSNKFFLVTQVVLLIILFITILNYIRLKNAYTKEMAYLQPKSAIVYGRLACKPKIGNISLPGLPCSYSARDANGAYFSILGIKKENISNNKISIGDPIKVMGLLTRDIRSKYNVLGTISLVP